MYRTASHCTLYWAKWIQSTPSHTVSLTFILILSFGLHLGLLNYLSPSVYPEYNSACMSTHNIFHLGYINLRNVRHLISLQISRITHRIFMYLTWNSAHLFIYWTNLGQSSHVNTGTHTHSSVAVNSRALKIYDKKLSPLSNNFNKMSQPLKHTNTSIQI
jgi:hypothetical protein